MNRPTLRRLTGAVFAAVCLVTVTAGCGVSTDAVLDALGGQTTTTAPAPASTTTPPTTVAPDTTPSTAAPSTTTGSGSPSTTSGSTALPAEAKDAFMQSCTAGGQNDEACACVWDAIEDELDIDTLLAAGSGDTLPAELEQKIVQAMMGCMLGTDD